MRKSFVTLLLLLTVTAVSAGNDIWQTLFKEKLMEATQGNSNAQYEVGAMYQNGRGVQASRDKAIEWYEKAAAQNNSKAVSRLKLMQASRERFKKELDQAGKGSIESQYNLGNMFTRGIGIDTNLKEAREWYRKAADTGHEKAEYQLGLIYYEGRGVSKNAVTAYQWFNKSAEKKYPPAQYYLGKLYAAGEGVKRNYTTALAWFTRAVDGGFDQARGEMIDMAEKLKTPQQTVAAATASAGTTRRVKSAENRRRSIMETLMLATWQRNEAPSSYLPSAVNNCRTADREIICYSDDQTRTTLTNRVKYKTKSYIGGFSEQGTFQVEYRNLVIDVEQLTTPATDEATGINDQGTADQGFKIKTGWGKEHRLECRLQDNTTISCLKDKTHRIEFVSPQQVADRK
ncbi:MAG: tetratricopeptide repeat protein [Gammaproteobacteria bacterium]